MRRARVGLSVRLKLSLLPLCALVVACAPAGPAPIDPFTRDGEVIAMGGGRGGPAQACFRCHGLAGQGDGVAAPRLAGLDAGYIEKQLGDYAAGLRRDDVMQAAVRWLSGADRHAVAVYYAQLEPPSGAGAAGAPPALWLEGDQARDLPPCAACHGDDARGVGIGGPALAGQPSAYTLAQMERWASAVRRNDPRNVMAIAASRTTPAENLAIADWLARQSPAPRPYSDAARVSDAQAAAEQLAASREVRRPDR